MKRVLLTGASGTVGREVLKQLSELPGDFEITVFDLKSKDSISFFRRFSDRIITIYGDISDKSDVCRACADQDAVIHLAAVIPPLADKDPQLARRVNIAGTRNLIECLEELSPKTFFLYSSSISVYGDRNKDPWISTTDPLKPSDRDNYAITKIEAEKLVMNSRLIWSIFRLTAIMGTNNHKPSALMFHMPLETPMEIATPRDTGRAFIKALDHPDELNGNVYNLSGGEKCRITYSDFLSRSFEIFGLGPLDFQKYTFAGKNFHCAYYKDGDLLNEILDFRQDSIEDHFNILRKSISPVRKFASTIFRNIIKRNLEKQSEPLMAMKTDNKIDIQHYF